MLYPNQHRWKAVILVVAFYHIIHFMPTLGQGVANVVTVTSMCPTQERSLSGLSLHSSIAPHTIYDSPCRTACPF